MIKQFRLPSTPEMGMSELAHLRRQLLLLWLVFVFYDAWIFLMYSVRVSELTPVGYACLAWGTCLSVGIYLLQRYWMRAAAWFAVLGSLALDVLILLEFGPTLGLIHLAMLVLMSGLLLGMRACILTAFASLVILFAPTPMRPPIRELSYWPATFLLASGLAYLLARGFVVMDHLEDALGIQQYQLISKLRDRQGELNRTLKALDEAYVNLKRTNDELIIAHQQADEARALKEQFVANVSHELRTPLNLIVGFVELMYLSPETYDGMTYTPDFESDLRQLYRAGRHLQDLLNDVLDLSRIDVSRLPLLREQQDLRAVVADAVETVAPLFRQRGLSYHVTCPDALPNLFIDRTRIRQVMLNLLNNAARFTDAGDISVQVAQTKDDVVVSVRDTGVGIPADQLEHVFEEFRQVDGGPRSRGGAGLGLAISRRFVQLHGGRVWVESQVGRGSSFFFTLPLPWTQAAPLTTIPARRKEFDTATAPVVVVDSDTGTADLLHRYLEQHRVLSAKTTDEAEALIEREHPLAVVVNTPPDAPSTQWSGSLGRLSERYAVPILRCSIPSSSWLQQASGFGAVLTKPISRSILTTTIGQLCQHPARVLVVDDDAGFVNLVTRMLSAGHVTDEVLKAYSGTQALRLAQEAIPDLVLLDLLMPEMDGFGVLRALRADPRFRATIAIAVTATSYADEVLSRHGGCFSISRSSGIHTGGLLDLIQGVLEVVRPDYVAEADHAATRSGQALAVQ